MTTSFDVIIIGGSYAGISAGLPLARARRRVLVIDAGERRNRFASHAHGLLAMDGRPPGEIAAVGKQQLLAYPTVTWRDGLASTARRGADGSFVVELRDGEPVHGARLVLAMGIRDELPATPGLRELWGTRVFHCPYCHGYELDRRPAAVLATGEHSLHQAMMLPDWGPTTLFVDGAFELAADHRDQLAARGVTVETVRVTAIAARGNDVEVRLADGRTHAFAGVFVAPRMSAATPLVESLGCALEPGPLGPYIKVDVTQQTSVTGVFACGDIARPAGSLPFAVGDGMAAGVAVHRSLVFPAA